MPCFPKTQSLCPPSITSENTNIRHRTSFLAGYFFAAPAAAKFMSQHLNCQLTYVSQIPAHILGKLFPFLIQTPILPFAIDSHKISWARLSPLPHSPPAPPLHKHTILPSTPPIHHLSSQLPLTRLPNSHLQQRKQDI
jgi:hypothetical protein